MRRESDSEEFETKNRPKEDTHFLFERSNLKSIAKEKRKKKCNKIKDRLYSTWCRNRDCNSVAKLGSSNKEVIRYSIFGKQHVCDCTRRYIYNITREIEKERKGLGREGGIAIRGTAISELERVVRWNHS